MTRVVADQKSKFESDELFRKLSRESEVRYTGYRDRTHEERIVRFRTDCREGRCPIAFTSSGTNLVLYLGAQMKEKKDSPHKDYVDFDKEQGKVHLHSNFVMNGVCVLFKGVMDLQRLDGTAYLELDSIQSKIEDKIMRDTIEQSRLRVQEFEERQRRVKQEPLEASDVADYRSWQMSSEVYGNSEYNPNMVFN